MRLIRLGPPGRERPAVAGPDGRWRDLRPVADDIDPALLGRLDDVRAALAADRLPRLDPADLEQRVGPPVSRPGKVVCIGLNYHDHAAETGAEVPAEPVVFMKSAGVIVGPDDTVLLPRTSTATDYEIELAVVIGREARYLTGDDEPLDHIAGYAISHDVSERDFQLHRGGTWDKGKNCETFNPLGPWLVTPEDIPDPQSLALTLTVNGQTRQDGTTREMIFPVRQIVAYLSQFMVLHPGDIVNTGTPAGVALGHPEPKPYLRAGDIVELSIGGLGRQRQTIGKA